MTGCSFDKKIELIKLHDFTELKWKNNELSTTINVELKNTSKFDITLLPSIFDVSINSTIIGQLKTLDTTLLSKQKTTIYPIKCLLQPRIENGLKLLNSLISTKEMNLCLNGRIKVSIKGIQFAKKINQQTEIERKNGLKFLKLLLK